MRSYPVPELPADSGFDHRMEWNEEALTICLRGQLVYETLVPLQSCWEAVRVQPRPTVFLDLSGVTYLASGPLGSLLALRRWLAERGHQLRLSALSSQVLEVLRMTGVGQIFSIDDAATATPA
jgi:anti-anti-sigma factor